MADQKIMIFVIINDLSERLPNRVLEGKQVSVVQTGKLNLFHGLTHHLKKSLYVFKMHQWIRLKIRLRGIHCSFHMLMRCRRRGRSAAPTLIHRKEEAFVPVVKQPFQWHHGHFLPSLALLWIGLMRFVHRDPVFVFTAATLQQRDSLCETSLSEVMV